MNKTIKILVPFIVLIGSMGVAWFLIQFGPEVEQAQVEKRVPAVSVVAAEAKTLSIPVYTRGTVIPGTEIQLSAEVAGKIISVSKNFKNGGFFKKGETLFTVDPTLFQLDVKKAEAMVATAKLNYEKAQANVEANRSISGLPQTDFSLGIPQLEEARTRYEAAKADAQLAQIQLRSASLKAPFRGRIRQKLVDVGKYVTPGMPVAIYYATATAEVRLPLTDEQQKLIDIPMQYEDNEPFTEPVNVSFTDTSGRYEWQGKLVRSEAGFDETNRLFYVVAEVNAPYKRDPRQPEKPPFAAGLFVDAQIEGRVHDRIIELPREVLHANDVVWTVDESSKLKKKQVEVLHRGRDTVFIANGINAGEQVITTLLDVAVDGMQVKILRPQMREKVDNSQSKEPIPSNESLDNQTVVVKTTNTKTKEQKSTELEKPSESESKAEVRSDSVEDSNRAPNLAEQIVVGIKPMKETPR